LHLFSDEPNTDENIASIDWCINLPPHPCAIKTVGYCCSEIGQVNVI
jgi:hypothetical protein